MEHLESPLSRLPSAPMVIGMLTVLSIVLLSCQKEDLVPLSSIGKPIPKNLFDCPADLDGDGEVTVDDLVEFFSQYEQSCDDCTADLNGDGYVDVDDFTQFNTAWQNPCDLQAAQMSVYPLGARFRFGDNDYPSTPVDPPIPDGSNLALGGVLVSGVDDDGQPIEGTVLASDSIRIDINGGVGHFVTYNGETLQGRTIHQVNGVTPANEYGYWRMSGRDDICNSEAEIGVDFDYEVEYFGVMYKVQYSIYYDIPGYPEMMEGTSYAFGFYETPVDDSCLNTGTFLAYPYSFDGTYFGPSYTIYPS